MKELESFPPDVDPSSFAEDVIAGLAVRPRSLPCKYFYDAVGAKLFDAITRLPEYYPTRTELSILRGQGASIARCIGPRARLVELGSGEGEKTPTLLAALIAPTAYAPIDISEEQLDETAIAIAARFPDVRVTPIAADYTRAFDVPEAPAGTHRTVAYFAGSTIGNFEPREAVRFLARLRELVGPDGAILLGADRIKDPAVLEAAYDDAAGLTAQFNKNLLVRMRHELGAEVAVDAFRHRAVWQPGPARIEMQLVSEHAQRVDVRGRRFDLDAGEVIVTEHCHKYDDARLRALAGEAGLAITASFRDERQWFGLELLEPE